MSTVPAHWTVRDNETQISHQKKIGQGGYGEVHEVSIYVSGYADTKMYDERMTQVRNPINTVSCYEGPSLYLKISDTDSKGFARKIVRPFSGVGKEDIENEVRAIIKLCKTMHPNIVQVFNDGPLQPDSAYYCIDMELCEFTLERYTSCENVPHLENWRTVRSNPDFPADVVPIIRDIVNGLVFIHSTHEVHRDLSPQNDFGLTSRGTSHGLVYTAYSRGKPCYRAPELLKTSNPGYNTKSDIWSLGCIMYELCTGEKAFPNDHAVFEYATSEENLDTLLLAAEESVHLFESFIRATLQIIPQQRWPARELLDFDIEAVDWPFKHVDFGDTKLAEITMKWAVSNNSISVVNVLVDYDAVGCIPNDDNESPLEQAARLGYLDIVKALLEVDVVPGHGWIALYFAALRGDINMVDVLLTGGVHWIDSDRDIDGGTLLLSSIANGHTEVVRLLLDAGFDINDLSDRGRLHIIIAAAKKYSHIMTLLHEVGVEPIEVPDSELAAIYISEWDKGFYTAQALVTALPHTLKREGEDWFALLNPDSQGEVDLTLLHARLYSNNISLITFSADGKYIAVDIQSSTQILLAETGTIVAILEQPAEDMFEVLSMVFSHDACNLITVDEGGRILIWDISLQTIKRKFADGESGYDNSPADALSISHDGTILVLGNRAKALWLWELESGQRLHKLQHLHVIKSVAISRDNRIAAVGQVGGRVDLWSINDGVLLGKLNLHKAAVSCLSFAQHEMELISADKTGAVKFCKLIPFAHRSLRSTSPASYTFECTLETSVEFGDELESVGISCDGIWAASGTTDLVEMEYSYSMRGSGSPLRLWNLVTGKPMLQLHRPRSHEPDDSFHVIAFAPTGDRKMFATGSGIGELRIWRF